SLRLRSGRIGEDAHRFPPVLWPLVQRLVGQILAHSGRSEHVPFGLTPSAVSFAIAPRDWRAATEGLVDTRRSARTPHGNKVRSSSIRPSPDGACRERSAWTRTDDLRW